MYESKFDGLLKWRSIGPYRGGRVVTVAGDVNDRNTFYFGACAGGVWKTEDGGTYWRNITDGYFNTAAVGAVAVSESDPNVIYAGTGEATIRIDVSHGDGVYRSRDAGETWTHVGLSDTRFIGKIRIHPTDPNTVFVAALGHAFGPNEERGVFKSTDGGDTWRKVLYKSNKAGAVDLTIDQTNPRIMYATIWETYRNFWKMSSGGEDSGLWKSVDGGETWSEITKNPGLPGNIWGKAAVVASPAKAGRVWALIENKDEGLYRSDDHGATWQLTSNKTDLLSRAWYYTHLTADPVDADTVWCNCLNLWKSSDGGATFEQIGTPHGDNHDIWIDPADNTRMVQGNDGGANVSYNTGVTWSTIYNQPTGQIYRMETDTRDAYRIYGTQQDNSSLSIPSRTQHSSITWTDCYLSGSGESGWVAPDPRDPDILFLGAIGSSPGGGNSLQRYNHRTKQIRLITTWPRGHRGQGDNMMKYRFSWTYPILFSKHDTNRIYAGGNHLFVTMNDGQSWELLSPDLTRDVAEHQEISGGPINREIGAAETYNTIFSVAEDNFNPSVIWTGSDDGMIHVTMDGGENWSDVTPSGLPEFAMVHTIEASPFDTGAAYLAATLFKLDDYAPYLFKTTDHGKTWTQINDGIWENDFTRVIRADPERKGLLYAGTETGLYVSLDDGASWERFQLNLPVCPIYDMKVKEKDLVVATHGRAFWVLDDLSTLHQYSDEATSKAVHLMQPRDSVRKMPFVFEGAFKGAPGKNYMSTLGLKATFTDSLSDDGVPERTFLDSGENPPQGVVMTWYLAETPDEPITLDVHDAEGTTIRSLRSRKADDKKTDGPFIPAKIGWNRFIWDMRREKPDAVKGDDSTAKIGFHGVIVAPGHFSMTLTVGDAVEKQCFGVLQEPGTEATQADLDAQEALWMQINAKGGEAAAAIERMRDVRAQLAGWEKRLEDEALSAESKTLHDAVLEIESALAVPGLTPGWTEPTNQGVRVYEQLSALPPVVYLGDFKPTDQAYEVFEELSAEIDAEITRFDTLLAGDIAAFNTKLSAAAVPAIVA